jgi:hypothetical protein
MSISIKCDGAECGTVGESSSPYHVTPPIGWAVLTFARERPGDLDSGTSALISMVEAGPKDDPRLGQMRKALKGAELRVPPVLVSFTAHLCPRCTEKIALDSATAGDGPL